MSDREVELLKSRRAPAGHRIGAYLVDTLIFAVVPGAAIGAVMSAVAPDAAFAAAFVLTALSVIVGQALALARDGAANGQTPGKRLLGLRVRTYDSDRIAFPRALAREATKAVVDGLPLLGLINIAAALFGSRRLAAQDDITNTIVVKADVSPADATALARTPDGRFGRVAVTE